MLHSRPIQHDLPPVAEALKPVVPIQEAEVRNGQQGNTGWDKHVCSG